MKIPERIESDHLVIRPFKEKDFPAFNTFMRHKEATRYLLFSEEQKSPEGIRAIFDQTISSYAAEEPIFSLVVADKTTDAYLGSVGMAPDENSEAAQIYWSIHPDHWDCGYGTEATRALLRYAFEVLDMDEIVAYSHPENLASLKVAHKVGMVNLGRKKFDWADEEAIFYRLTPKEFYQ
jgi:ribosomal-protein-alanine N-acetyltransferase